MVSVDQLRDSSAQGISVVGYLDNSSNGAYVVDASGLLCVYKPQAHETPLWDFPEATLSRREVAASLIDRMMGFGVVPATIWYEKGPYGPGSLQHFIEDATIDDVVIHDPEQVPEGFIPIVRGQLAENDVMVSHRDAVDVRKLALLDAVLNNADRKAGHILRDAQGSLYGIDHGVCFNEEPKLRTILWGYAEQSLTTDEIRILSDLDNALEHISLPGLNQSEHLSLRARIASLIAEGFPVPSPHWPAIPWPVF